MLLDNQINMITLIFKILISLSTEIIFEIIVYLIDHMTLKNSNIQ